MLPVLNRIKAVRFDPSYHYNGTRPARLAAEMAEKWKKAGFNLVFFRAYDPYYGSFYRTSHLHNKQGEFGRYDLLRHIVRACAAEGIRVFAWLPVLNHHQAWMANPEWARINSRGSPFSAPGQEYPLCPRNPEVVDWWLGFVSELLDNYPGLAGVDLAEPIVSWNAGEACHCPFCLGSDGFDSEQEYVDWRALPLTTLLRRSIDLVHGLGRQAALTFVASANPSGELLSWEELKRQIGFDLTGLLASPEGSRLDLLVPEFIWQEWQSVFRNRGDIFSPDWVAGALLSLQKSLDHPVAILPHLEITDFPGVSVDAGQLAEALRAVLQAGAIGFDVYSSKLLDEKNAWSIFSGVDDWFKLKSCLVIYDVLGDTGDAVQIGELLRHFKTRVELLSLNDYRAGLIENHDYIFYIGKSPDTIIPEELIQDAAVYRGVFCWLGTGIGQLLARQEIKERLGLEYLGETRGRYDEIVYKNRILPKNDPLTQVIAPAESSFCLVLAEARLTDGAKSVPYALRCGRSFWIFTDLPSNYALEGGSFLVFADLLHDILQEDHVPMKTALLRIEDIHPLTDPGRLRAIADFLYGRNVPFLFAVTPYYVNPELNIRVSLAEMPELVSALKYMVRKGGVPVMHGVTHQRYLESTADYEFWDPVSDGPVKGENPAMKRQRLDDGIREFWSNGVFPLLWETPHYAASTDFYELVAGIFSMAMERKQAVDKKGSDQLLPYVLPADRYGQILLPENLGYVPLDNPDPELILKPAGRMEVVRDATASFFFHPFVDIDVLKKIVRQMQRRGFVFTGPAKIPVSVRTSFGALSFPGSDLQFVPAGNRGLVRRLFYPGIESSSEEIIAIPGRRLEIDAVAGPEMITVVDFSDILQTSLTKESEELAGKPLEKPADCFPVVDFEGKEARIPFPMLLESSEANPVQEYESNAYQKLFQVQGVHILKENVEDFSDLPVFVNLLIIPEAAATRLSNDQLELVLRAIENGRISLMTSGFSLLSDALGIEKQDRLININRVEDLAYSDLDIIWAKEFAGYVFSAPAEAEYLYRERSSGMPLLVSVPFGQGKFLFSGPLIEVESGSAGSRFPHYVVHALRSLGFFPLLRGRGAEIYYNPAEREDIAVENLIKYWRRSGIKVVHVAAWHFYPEWQYDYTRLIKLAHENAILVHAWLEPPLVHKRFWLDHPHWREKDAQGLDYSHSWRHAVALGDPAARIVALREWRRILESEPWDGVTVNRLGFEWGTSENPQSFTPFHPTIRNRFREQAGFDPSELFSAESPFFWKSNPQAYELFMEFRRVLAKEYLFDLLDEIAVLKREKNPDLQVVVSYDSRRLDSGVSLDDLEEIRSRYGVFWQYLPEPEDQWCELATTFDLLHVDLSAMAGGRNPITTNPLSYPTGLSLYEKLLDLVRKRYRFTLGTEASLYEIDAHMLPFIFSSGPAVVSEDDRIVVISENGGEIVFAGEMIPALRISGRPAASFFRNRLLLPPGEHEIKLKVAGSSMLDSLKSAVRLVDSSAEIRDMNLKWNGLSLDLFSERNAYIVLSKKPLEIIVNGRKANLPILQGQRGWSIRLPRGENKINVVTRTKYQLFMSLFSQGLAGVIVAVSVIAVFIFVCLFLLVHIRRRSDEKER